jgi:enoyl-CoA hydratase/carnithine racemase
MAMEMSYTGRVVDAAEAERIGLVNHVVAHEELLPATLTMAATIASRDPAVLRQLKKLYRVSTTVTMGAAMAHELRERDRRRAAGQALTPLTVGNHDERR